MPDSFSTDHDQPLTDSNASQASYQRVLEYLYGRLDYERTTQSRDDHEFRLERTVALFDALGLGDYLFHPHQSSASPSRPPVPIVHIAGTKGKGSTASMVSSILVAAGYRVGLYTSPHLTDLEERFRIDGVSCGRDALVELVDDIRPTVDRFDQSGEPVSFFELTTAIAVAYFDRNECDVIVLEVGLGGRLDSTNVCVSSVAAITSIGLDHQRVLGDTLAKIAAEKAGIIKGNVPVISGVTDCAAAEVVRRVASNGGSDLWEIDVDFRFESCRETEMGTDFDYLSCDQMQADSPPDRDAPSRIPISLPLVGKHQVHNAAVAISIVRRLCQAVGAKVVDVSEIDIRRGLQNVRCNGRLERFWLAETIVAETDSTEVENARVENAEAAIQVIVDTAHNHDSMVALCESIQRRVLPNSVSDANCRTDKGAFQRDIVVVFAVSRDKDGGEMASELMKIADRMICTEFVSNPRSLAANELFAEVGQLQPTRSVEVSCESDPRKALTQAIQSARPGGTVVISGSFFLAGELRPLVLSLAGGSQDPCAAGESNGESQPPVRSNAQKLQSDAASEPQSDAASAPQMEA